MKKLCFSRCNDRVVTWDLVREFWAVPARSLDPHGKFHTCMLLNINWGQQQQASAAAGSSHGGREQRLQQILAAVIVKKTKSANNSRPLDTLPFKKASFLPTFYFDKSFFQSKYQKKVFRNEFTFKIHSTLCYVSIYLARVCWSATWPWVSLKKGAQQNDINFGKCLK